MIVKELGWDDLEWEEIQNTPMYKIISKILKLN